MDWKTHYQAAHEEWFKHTYPEAHRSGYYCKPKMPQVNKANGLTQFVINFLTWSGWRATRISSSGRYVMPTNKYDKGGWIPGTTRKGTADISATIKGRAVMLEIKVGKDRPSPHQLAEQERERKAGGIFEFVSTPDEFFDIYNKIMNL